MKENITSAASDWSLWTLGAIGIYIHPYEYFSGIFFAAAGAVISSRFNDPSVHVPKSNVWYRVFTAFFISSITAMILATYLPDWNPVPIMGLVGFCSDPIVRVMSKVVGAAEEKAPDIILERISRKLNIETKDGKYQKEQVVSIGEHEKKITTEEIETKI